MLYLLMWHLLNKSNFLHQSVKLKRWQGGAPGEGNMTTGPPSVSLAKVNSRTQSLAAPTWQYFPNPVCLCNLHLIAFLQFIFTVSESFIVSDLEIAIASPSFASLFRQF